MIPAWDDPITWGQFVYMPLIIASFIIIILSTTYFFICKINIWKKPRKQIRHENKSEVNDAEKI